MGINHAVNEELLKNNYQYKKLYSEHAATKEQLKAEASRPAMDATKVALLKRKKLKLADEMSAIEAAML